MKNKTYRFAAALAVLLALALVFVAPVGATYSGNVFGTEQNPYIAMSFDNLTEAFAESADTIYVKLGASFSNESSLVVPENKKIILDLAGYTITATDTIQNSFGFINLNPGSTFILNDSVGGGKINLTANNNRGWNAYSSVISVQRANATINGGTIQHLGGTDMAYGVDVLTNGENTYAKLIVNGGSIISTYTGVRLFENGASPALCSLEVNGGSIYGYNRGVWCQDANANVNPYSVKVTGGCISSNLNGAIHITGNVGTNTEESGSVKITGGTLTSSSEYGTIYVKDMDNVKSGFELSVGSNAVIENTGNGTAVSGVDAKIGENYYVHFSDAIAAAKSGETITLLSDVTLTESITIEDGDDITIEGNGKTISGACDIFIVTGGKLTLGEGLNVESSTDCAIFIKGGDVISSANLNSTSTNYATVQGNGNYAGNVTINGGTIESTNDAIYYPQNGVLTINGGTITGNTAVYFKSGSLKITGGSFNGIAAKADYVFNGNGCNPTGDALIIENVGGDTGYEVITSVSISGGTFTSANAAAVGSYTAGNDGVAAVTGFITGGTFSSNPSAYIASGYEVVPSGDKYLVQKYVDRSSSSPSSATDTGSGNFAEYPRQADGTAGEIDFGSSKDVKSVDLPEGVTGEVKLIAKSSHPAPEGKDTHKVFEINIPNYPTGKPATIKFEMTLAEIEAKGLTAADVCLYHFDKETGIWTKLPTTYKVVDGKVYFEAVTTGFSPFAIVFEEGAATPVEGADEPVTPPTETPDVSGEDLPEIQDEPTEVLPPAADEPADEPTESPLPILAVLAGLGAAVVLRRK